MAPMKTRQIRPFRTCLVVDLENATRSASPSRLAAETLHWRLSRVFVNPPDETFVASDPRNAFSSERYAELSHGGFRVRSGRNGADLAIIDYLEEVIERNQRHRKHQIGYVRILSGDGIFIPVIRKLRQVDIHVTVIGYRDTTNHGLYREANRLVLLDDSLSQLVAA